MIPKLIHQTAKTADIPPQWQAYQRAVRALHPDWTYKLWTDADNLAFVRAEFPDFLDTYVGLPKNIMRADVIRYLLMVKVGGLYLDLDYEMLKPFDDLTGHEAVLPWESAGKFGPGNDLLGNCVFASAPGHPIFQAMIDDLKRNPPRGDDADVLSGTGPKFVTRIYKESPGLHARVYAPPQPQFHPETPKNPRERKAIIDKGVAYGIHHCDGTWREYGLAKRLKMKVAGVWHRVRPAPKGNAIG